MIGMRARKTKRKERYQRQNVCFQAISSDFNIIKMKSALLKYVI